MKLYKRENGTWYIREFPGDVRRSLKTKNKTVALERYKDIETSEVLRRLAPYSPREKTSITIGAFVEQYLKDRQGKKADNTLRIDRESLSKLLSYIPANTPLREITPKQADGFIAHMIGQGLVPTTVNIALRHVKGAFSQAVKWEYLDRSPFTAVRPLEIKDTLPRSLNIEELRRLFSVIDNEEFRKYLFVCLYTGMRRSEAATLQWEDFKKYGDRWYIKVSASKTRSKNLPLADRLRDLLWSGKQDVGPVFPYYSKHEKEASRHYRRYATLAGIDSKLHDTRHTCATLMLLDGTNIRAVQGVLGHANVKTTEIYTKLFVEHLFDAVNRLNLDEIE